MIDQTQISRVSFTNPFAICYVKWWKHYFVNKTKINHIHVFETCTYWSTLLYLFKSASVDTPTINYGNTDYWKVPWLNLLLSLSWVSFNREAIRIVFYYFTESSSSLEKSVFYVIKSIHARYITMAHQAEQHLCNKYCI